MGIDIKNNKKGGLIGEMVAKFNSIPKLSKDVEKNRIAISLVGNTYISKEKLQELANKNKQQDDIGEEINHSNSEKIDNGKILKEIEDEMIR